MLPTQIVADMSMLYQRYHRTVYLYLLRLSSSPSTAEDLLQETFYRAMRGAGGYRGEAAPATWLCAIARRLFINHCVSAERERQRRTAVDLDTLTDPIIGLDGVADQVGRKAMIAGVLGQLPETQRIALLLRDADGLSYEEIAAALGLSLANVKVTIHRARHRFRDLYLKEKEDEWHGDSTGD